MFKLDMFSKLGGAQVTRIRVDSSVGFELVGRRENLVTNITFVWFFNGVHRVMPFQMPLLPETPRTGVALKRKLSSMSAHVNF